MFDLLALASQAKPFLPYALSATAGAGGYLWFATKQPMKRSIRLSAREGGLSIKSEKAVRETDKDGNYRGTSTKTTYKDVKVRINADKEGIVSIVLIVPGGIAEDKVVAFRQTLESIAGLRLLPPERDSSNVNAYKFVCASFSKKNS